MARDVLRDRNNKVIGYTQENGVGATEIRDPNNRRLGYYDPDRNITFNHGGSRVGTGNLLTSLLDD